MRLITSLFILALVFPSCYAPNQLTYYSPSSGAASPKGMPSKPGACYAKCLTPDEYDVTVEEIFLFTGDPENTDVEIRDVENVISVAGTKWVKKKADKNCLSANPDDCLVWCLEEVPGEVERYTVVVDTSQTDQYEVVAKEHRNLIQSGGHTEWYEVVCENNMSKALIMDVQHFLASEKYYFGEADGVLDQGIKEALKNFQTERGLGIGQLTIETLDVMGVGY